MPYKDPEKAKEHYQKPEVKEYMKKYRQTNKDKIKERQQKYRQTNKEKLKERRKERDQIPENKEHRKEYLCIHQKEILKKCL